MYSIFYVGLNCESRLSFYESVYNLNLIPVESRQISGIGLYVMCYGTLENLKTLERVTGCVIVNGTV